MATTSILTLVMIKIPETLLFHGATILDTINESTFTKILTKLKPNQPAIKPPFGWQG